MEEKFQKLVEQMNSEPDLGIYNPEERENVVFHNLDRFVNGLEYEFLNPEPDHQDKNSKLFYNVRKRIHILNKDVDKFPGPHYNVSFRKIEQECTSLQKDLDKIESSSADVETKTMKRGELQKISTIESRLHSKVHKDNSSCSECT